MNPTYWVWTVVVLWVLLLCAFVASLAGAFGELLGSGDTSWFNRWMFLFWAVALPVLIWIPNSEVLG